MHPKQIASSKIVVALLVVLLAFLTNIKYRQWREEQSVNKLRDDLLQQAATQQKKSQDLNNSLSYLNSNDFKEQVARQQLDLKKNGELVYNFTQNDATVNTSKPTQSTSKTNQEKWWQYFFGNKIN
jgi:cell division protein FtsB